jgi:hypothetical protein
MDLLTLRQVRERLWVNGLPADGGPSSYRDADDQQISDWNLRLNRVIQTFFEKIVVARTYRTVDVPIYGGQFTLPREVRSALLVTLLGEDDVPCAPVFIYSRFHQFAQCCSTCNPGRPVQPLDENAQTFRIPSGNFRLRVTSTEANGVYQLIGGRDTDSDEYFDSVELAITNGSATTAREWSTLPRFVKPVTNVACEVYSVDDDDAATLIAVHAPGETNPAYQRYSAPQWSEEPAARVLTRLCYVALSADTDIVYPSSYRALQRGLMALRYDDNGDDERADKAWQDALDAIDSDKQLLEGEAQVPLMRAMPGFGCADMPSNGGWPAFYPWSGGNYYGD